MSEQAAAWAHRPRSGLPSEPKRILMTLAEAERGSVERAYSARNAGRHQARRREYLPPCAFAKYFFHSTR